MTETKDQPAQWRTTHVGAGIYEGEKQIAVVLPGPDRLKRAKLMATAPKLLALAKDYEQLWLASCIDDPENCTDCTDDEPCMAHAQLKEIQAIIAEAEGKA